MRDRKNWVAYAVILWSVFLPRLGAELWLPNIFGDHMVLQRDLDNPIWGKAQPGERISVTIGGKVRETTAGPDGRWLLKLDPMGAGGPYELTVRGDSETLQFQDVLVGEVWFCSGQSNMLFNLGSAFDSDVEIASANYPEIRLLQVPRRASLEPLEDFEGGWNVCSPRTASGFSAVGYLFGRQLHNALGVPVGLVANPWGGSCAEAWLPMDLLMANEETAEVVAEWKQDAASYTDEMYERDMAEYKKQLKEWERFGQYNGQRRPFGVLDKRLYQRTPSGIFNGMVYPTIGYGMRGIIWYQGESNTPTAKRAGQYRDLFPTLINYYRDIWGQGDFPFYWVQLPAYGPEFDDPNGDISPRNWAVLREAQSGALSLPNTGQAVAIDLGEGNEIHPGAKQAVARRLARQALARDYGYELVSGSPQCASAVVDGSRVTLTFDQVDEGLYAYGRNEVSGFSIAGEDGVFYWAEATIPVRNQVVLQHVEVRHPVEVRYAWGDNPPNNLRDRNGLPVTPFRVRLNDEATRGLE
ncbi:sialate O-acetylesterase [Ruficoccus amylovorans]|uniref:Sialate O-acetylesterase n=2 Tax=Ruficoccus amylovorans TaxID=1804625 RepID=A0A842HDN0_9BACT|nr:sialate O-acetylesterase [Ruficoccus amylovorans]